MSIAPDSIQIPQLGDSIYYLMSCKILVQPQLLVQTLSVYSKEDAWRVIWGGRIFLNDKTAYAFFTSDKHSFCTVICANSQDRLGRKNNPKYTHKDFAVHPRHLNPFKEKGLVSKQSRQNLLQSPFTNMILYSVSK